MAQMTLSTKQKQTHRGQTCGCQGGGAEGQVRFGSFGLVEANCQI